MVDPPSDTGADQASETEPLPGIVVRPVGAPGVVRGVALTVGLLALPVPAALIAETLNV